MRVRMLLVICIAALLCMAALTGCSLIDGGQSAEETLVPAQSTPTAEPQVVVFEAIATEVPAAITPTPTPEPTATPIPFSFYAPTVNMSYEELVGSSTDDVSESAKVLLKDGFPDPKTYYIIVDKAWQVVLVYKRLDDGTKYGKPDLTQPVRYMLCSTGNPDSQYGHETTSGIWDIEIPKERFYQFVNLEAAQYLTLIHSRTYFHSILYDRARDLSTLIQQSYDDLGKKASHACIRLTVPDSRWIWYNIGYGTSCEIRNGSISDTDTQNIRNQLKLPPSKSSVSLKPGGADWTDNWSIDDVEHVLAYKYQKAPLPDLGDGTETEGGGTTSAPTEGGSTGGTVVDGESGGSTGGGVIVSSSDD